MLLNQKVILFVLVLINGLGSSNLHDIMSFGMSTRACGLVWSMLVRLGRTDSGSNPGRPTTIYAYYLCRAIDACISSLQLYQQVSPERTYAIFLWNYSSLIPISDSMGKTSSVVSFFIGFATSIKPLIWIIILSIIILLFVNQ